MRCENCGYQNDDKVYICQNCGSPLYEEDEIQTEQFQNHYDEGNVQSYNNYEQNLEKEQKKNKISIITIVVLSIILVALIGGTIFGIAHNKSNKNNSSSETSTSSNSDIDNENDDFIKETTSKKDKESISKKDSKQETFNVRLNCTNGGEVEGDGKFNSNASVTVIARPDDGYDFDGWYNGSKKVSSSTKYTFKVTENTTLKAKFVKETTTKVTNKETTTKATTVTQTTTETTTKSTTEPTTENTTEKTTVAETTESIQNVEGIDD